MKTEPKNTKFKKNEFTEFKKKQSEKPKINICLHGYTIQFQNATILHNEENNSTRKTEESALILLNGNDFDTNTSVKFTGYFHEVSPRFVS